MLIKAPYPYSIIIYLFFLEHKHLFFQMFPMRRERKRLPRVKALHQASFFRVFLCSCFELNIQYLTFSERRWGRHCCSLSGNQLYIGVGLITRHPGNEENGGEACSGRRNRDRKAHLLKQIGRTMKIAGECRAFITL